MNTPAASAQKSQFMAGVIVLILLAMFAFVLIVPAFIPQVQFDPALVQTLLTLCVVGVSHFIGTSKGSALKDETILIQAARAAEQSPAKFDDTKPGKEAPGGG